MDKKNAEVKISIIIPTRNRSARLAAAIDSVLRQTIDDWELIIVDDASTDDTEEVVRSFGDRRIRYFRHDSQRGGAEARNTGIKEARGRYVAFLDDDDEWLPGKLEAQLKIFEDNPRAGAVYTGFFIRYDDGKGVLRVRKPRKRGSIYRDMLINNVVGTTSTVMVKAECLRRVGGFDGNLPASQDADLWRRISKWYEFDFVEKPLVIYNAHSGEKISGDFQAAVKACEIELEKFREDYARDRKVRSLRMFKYGKLLVAAGERERARKALLEAIKANPLRPAPYLLMLVISSGEKATRAYLNLRTMTRKALRKLIALVCKLNADQQRERGFGRDS